MGERNEKNRPICDFKDDDNKMQHVKDLWLDLSFQIE
jgi:hypothetical protein